jgi:hypothetical protein
MVSALAAPASTSAISAVALAFKVILIDEVDAFDIGRSFLPDATAETVACPLAHFLSGVRSATFQQSAARTNRHHSPVWNALYSHSNAQTRRSKFPRKGSTSSNSMSAHPKKLPRVGCDARCNGIHMFHHR